MPPDEVVGRGWEAVLEFLNEGATVAVHELRLMLIGDGEVGNTSLQRAFAAPGHKAEQIGKEERAVGIDLIELLFEGGEGPVPAARRARRLHPRRCYARGTSETVERALVRGGQR